MTDDTLATLKKREEELALERSDIERELRAVRAAMTAYRRGLSLNTRPTTTRAKGPDRRPYRTKEENAQALLEYLRRKGKKGATSQQASKDLNLSSSTLSVARRTLAANITVEKVRAKSGGITWNMVAKPETKRLHAGHGEIK